MDFQELLRADPEEAMKLLNKLKKYAIEPHPGQRKVLDSPARYKVLNCGRRWGKTKIGAKVIIDQTRTAPPGSVTWWVAPTYKIVKRGYREVLRQLPRDLLTHDPPSDSSFDAGRSVILKFKNGSQMEFYSAERPEGMLGEGVSFAVLDEAATMPSRIWEQVVRPTLMDKKGGAMLISTPRGRNWFYKRYVRGQDPQKPEWASWTFTSYDNPFVEDAEIKEMEDELPTVLFEQEAMAKFIAAGSNVFEWDIEYVQRALVGDNGMVEGESVSGQHAFLGVDLAKTTDFTVLYGAAERTRRNVYFERFHSPKWSEQKRRIRRAVGKLMRAGATGVTLVMDSTGVGDPIVEDMEDAGFDVVGINFTTYKNKMVMLLAKDLETGRAFLLEDQIEEFENYQLNQTEKGRITYSAPEGEHDDVVSAKMLSHWGMVNEGAPGILGADDYDEASASATRNPWDEEEGEDEDADWSDLVDADVQPLTAAQILHAAPTAQELLLRDDVWN
jgi:Terminase large subunit, T4likevirus-type, N-terminal